jgi:hypothetical protein
VRRHTAVLSPNASSSFPSLQQIAYRLLPRAYRHKSFQFAFEILAGICVTWLAYHGLVGYYGGEELEDKVRTTIHVPNQTSDIFQAAAEFRFHHSAPLVFPTLPTRKRAHSSEMRFSLKKITLPRVTPLPLPRSSTTRASACI